MKNNFFKTAKSNLLKAATTGLFVVYLSAMFAFEANAGWKFWERKGICEKLVEPIVNKSIRSLVLSIKGKEDIDHKRKEMDHVKNECYQSILKTGDYKELYAYYLFYKYADEALKVANKGNDNAPNNIYHYMLFYANENSRNFNEKELGLYEQELKDFEDNMTQEEKIKAFSYIADNLATGKEGWVKVNDYRKSFEYLKRAAEAGDNFSQSELGTCYFYGADRFSKFSFEKDYNKAYKWTYLATKHSTTNSYDYKIISKNLKTIEIAMTKKQITESKQEVGIWLKNNDNFVKNNPLKIVKMTEGETKKAKKDYQEKIKKYNMFPSNQTN